MFSIYHLVVTVFRITIVVAAPAATSNLVDCPAWPYPDNELVWAPNSCITYKDVVVDGGRTQIYREAVIPSPKTNAIIRERLFATRGRVAQVVNFYSTHLKQNLQKALLINLTMVHTDKILVAEYPDTDAATDTHTGGRPCHVVLKIVPSKPKTWIAHLVAHELYHCVQMLEHPDRARTENDLMWILDGSANFFEYLQYPYHPPRTIDENAPHYYNPSVALYRQQYASCLFFHHLHNHFSNMVWESWDLLRIDTWVRQRNLTSSAAVERAMLADDGEISSAFGRFATKFHDQKIYFDAKNTLHIKTDNDVPKKALQIVNLDPGSDPVALGFGEVVSWTFKKYSAQLQPKQTISATIKWRQQPAPKVIVWHRKLLTGKKSSPWARTLPKIFHSGCSGAPVTYEFLVVPVAKEAIVEGSIEFRRERDATCSCSTKTSGGEVVKRSPELLKDAVLVARQFGNETGACVAPDSTPSSTHVAQITYFKVKIGDVIRSIMGYPVGSRIMTVDVDTIAHTSTTCASKSIETKIAMSPGIGTTMADPTQQTNLLVSFISTLTDPGVSQMDASMQPTQIFETPKPYSTAPGPSSTLTPISNNTWTEDDEVWDGSWDLPDTSFPEEDSVDEVHDSDTAPNDDEPDCDKPKLGCLFGSWTADKASMEEHLKKPYFRYSPPPFSPATTKFSATYTLTFKVDPLDPENQKSMVYHEVLVESGENTASSDKSPNFLQWFSTTTIDGSMDVGGEVLVSSELGWYETGNIWKRTRANTTNVGEIKVSFDHNPFSISTRHNGTAYGPNGSNYSYNCTGDTLHFGYALSNSRNYVMYRI